MKGVIVLYVLPMELLDLKEISERLLKSFRYIEDDSRWKLHAILGTSEEIIDWESSRLTEEWAIEEFNKIAEDWTEEDIFEVRKDVLGCSDARRVTIDEHPDADYFIWLDPDIIFDELTLFYIDKGIDIGEGFTDEPFIITPEIVRIWDSTWDCLVNERFLDKPLDYQKTNNAYVDTVFNPDFPPTLEEVHNNVSGLPRFKFAGGWFNCYSAKILRNIGIPKTLGPYGVEDTWLMHAMEKLVVQQRESYKQFKLKNIIVGENYLYRDDTKIDGINLIDRRQEFRKEAHRQANLALQDL